MNRVRGRFPSLTVLVPGFGGLLLLLAFAGLDAGQALQKIQAANDAVREDFLSRSRMLERIRADLYLSSTYARDYLLQTEPASAEAGAHLLRTHQDIEGALSSYDKIVRPDERAPFEALRRELDAYWNVLAPVFRWSASERREKADAYLRAEVFPMRAAMLHTAGHIAAMNKAQLDAGGERVSIIFTRHRGRLVVTAILTLGLGLLLAAFNISRVWKLERQAAARYLEVEQARGELKRLSVRLVEAQENERRAISRELHDEVGQALSATLVDLGNLSTAIRLKQEAAANERVESARGMVEQCVAAVRNMALLLRPSMLDDLGLVPALDWQARETTRRTGVQVRLAAHEVSDDLPEEHRTCIYRLVQEALHNAARHAHARRVRVAVRQEPARIVVTVQDDGTGFDPAVVRGLGLLGMEERVTYLGGHFRVDSSPGKGTLLTAELPLAASLLRAAS